MDDGCAWDEDVLPFVLPSPRSPPAVTATEVAIGEFTVTLFGGATATAVGARVVLADWAREKAAKLALHGG